MFLKQKQSSHNFDFSKVITHKKETKSPSTLSKVIKSFMLIQLAFFAYNVNNFESYIDNINEQENQISLDYLEMQKAMKLGDQDKSIALFSKLKNHNTAVTDLFAGGDLLLVQTPALPDTPIEYVYKLTPETIHTLNVIYQQDLNAGINKQTKQLNNLTCFYGDLTCYAGRAYLQNQLPTTIKIVTDKINQNNYNLTHMDKYLTWTKENRLQIDKGNYNYSKTSPGQLYVNSLK